MLKNYNIATHNVDSNNLGYVMIDIPNQTYIDSSISSFTVSISAGNQIHHGFYTLKKNDEQSTPESPVYECTTQIGSAVEVLTYDFRYRDFIKYTVKSDKVTIGYFKLNSSDDLKVVKDESIVQRVFKLRTDSIGQLEMDVEDPGETICYTANYDPTTSYSSGDIVDTFKPTVKSSQLVVKIPDSISDSKSREFIVAIDNLDMDNDTTLMFQYNSEEGESYHFFLNGTDVTDGVKIHDKKTVLKFVELRHGVFAIDEMSNTDYFNVITISALTGDIDVLRVAKTASISVESVVDSTISNLSVSHLTSDNAVITSESVLTSTIKDLTAS